MRQKTDSRKKTEIPARLRRHLRQRFFVSAVFFLGFSLLFFAVFVIFSQTVAVSQNASPAKTSQIPDPDKTPQPETPVFTPKMHPWGSFEPGAWRLTKIATEIYSPNQQAENITYTENCVTLQKVEPEAFSLVIESLVNLGGKSVTKEPQTLHQGIHGLDPSEFQKFYLLKHDTLYVDSQPIPCQVLQFTFSDEKVRKVVTIWLNSSRSPYIFRKETTIRNLSENRLEEFTQTQVTALNCQVAVFGKIYKGYQSKIDSAFPSRKVHTVLVSSSDIPGGIVSRVAQETDLQDRLLQVTSAELLDFGVKEGDHQNEMSRNTPFRAARYTVPRPVKMSDVPQESPRTISLTINFSKENQEERKGVNIFTESLNFAHFRDHQLRRPDRDGTARTEILIGNQDNTSGEPPFMHLKVGNILDLVLPSAEQGGHANSFLIGVSPPSAFAPVPTMEEKNITKNERKSPLQILRRNEPRKKRLEPVKSVALLDSAESSWAGEPGYETAEFVAFNPQEEKEKQRGAWRRHWRAIIIGEQY